MTPAGTASERTASRIGVLVLSDDPALCARIGRQLTTARGYACHADGERTARAMAAIRRHTPDVVLVDYREEGVDPLLLTKSIQAEHPALPLILMSAHANPVFASRALRAGAKGYLLKSEATQGLCDIIQRVVSGSRYVSENVMQHILHGLSAGAAEPDRSLIDHLSDRELVIFNFIGQGHPVRRIAEELRLSIKTVATHRSNIRRKLQLPDTQQLARWARTWIASEQSGRAMACMAVLAAAVLNVHLPI